MKQSIALDILKQGYSVFLTGQAGAGKTYLLNQYIQYLHQHGIPVAITASTGIASTHMNGMTIHSWSGIGIKDSFDSQDFARLKKRTAVIDRLKAVRVLIIDEVSMLHARQLDLIDEILRHVREDERPFGGVQVVFSGDFFQLPPIGQKDETTKDKFAFMSKAWITLAKDQSEGSPAIKVCYLTEQHRQTDSQTEGLTLNDILNQIRTQTITQNAIDTLLATKDNDVLPHRTRLYTHNLDVDTINETELDKLKGKTYTFEATAFGEPALVESLKKNVRTQETLILKKGAKVMFIKNNPQEDYYNGTIGEVVGFVTEGNSVIPKVKLNDGRTILATAETWSIDDEDGEALASFCQVPLCLAWAITIHKSQGMTLDSAEIDLSRTFELGQGYVALSRVKSLAGLKILGLNQKSLLLDEFAQVANRRFLTLSDECQAHFLAQNPDDIAKRQEAFLTHNATLPKPSPTKAPTPTTTNTLDKSNFIAQIHAKTTLDDLKKSTNLAKSTLITYLGEALENGNLDMADITYLLPNEDTIEQIQTAYQTLDDKGELDDKPISKLHEELEGKISYDDIRLIYTIITHLSQG